MKKILVLMLAVLLLTCTAGCEAPSLFFQNTGYTQQSVTAGVNRSDFPGITVGIKSLNAWDGKTELTVAWENDTEYDVLYGASYTIERLENGEWASCAKQEELFFIAIGYELKAGGTRNESYDLTDIFDVSAPGTYRFLTDCYVQVEPEKSEKCALWAEFTVGFVKCPEDSKEAKGTSGDGRVEFNAPPAAWLVHSGGSVAVRTGGYSWFCTNSDGTTAAVIADQAGRIPEKEVLLPVFVEECWVKLEFEAAPDRLEIVCWPDTVWENSKMPLQETVSYQEDLFCAKLGGYVYEITAEWEDTGSGYHGTANYYVYIVADEAHIHITAEEAETVAEPFAGYCGNTQTTLYIGEMAYTFSGGHSVTLTDILHNLDYKPESCRCISEYTVDTEFGTGYEVNLTEGFARCETGQARLSREQVNKIRQIVEWAETTGAQYLLND